MTIKFATTTPPVRTSPGRVAEPNPYAEAVKNIALKTDKDNRPVALSFTATHDADHAKAKPVLEKIRRQLSNAGRDNEPRVSVNIDFTPVKDSKVETTVTFWTTKYTPRPRKEKTDATTETTNTTDTVEA